MDSLLASLFVFSPHNDEGRSHQSFFKTIIQINLIMLLTLTELILVGQNSAITVCAVLRNQTPRSCLISDLSGLHIETIAASDQCTVRHIMAWFRSTPCALQKHTYGRRKT